MAEDFKMDFVYMYPIGEAKKDAFPIQSMRELGILELCPSHQMQNWCIFSREAIFRIWIQIKWCSEIV